MKKLSIFALLAVILGLPFCLREAQIAEQYPAVLFPIGAHRVKIESGRIRFQKSEIWSVDGSGTEHELDPNSFVDPIPPHYWPGLASQHRQFGLIDPTPDRQYLEKQIGLWQIRYYWHRRSTAAEKKEVVQWITERLNAVGRPQDRIIRVRARTITVDTGTGRELASETVFAYEIRLDDYDA